MQRRGPSCKSSTGLVLEVVCDYKHVGSFVTVTGGLVREAAHRTKASQTPFCSLGRKFLETHSLSTRVRLSLANSMCDSRLLSGVECRPCCTGSAIQKLHVQRMKWLRTIDLSEVRSRDKESDCSDDAEQPTEHKEPDRDVLCRLEHTTVEVRVRRLACCPRFLKHAPRVSSRCCNHHAKSGWYIDRGVRFFLTISILLSVRLVHASLSWETRNSHRMLGQAACVNTRG